MKRKWAFWIEAYTTNQGRLHPKEHWPIRCPPLASANTVMGCAGRVDHFGCSIGFLWMVDEPAGHFELVEMEKKKGSPNVPYKITHQGLLERTFDYQLILILSKIGLKNCEFCPKNQ
jgi:hypothetical protein